jgi:hypothetical protein
MFQVVDEFNQRRRDMNGEVYFNLPLIFHLIHLFPPKIQKICLKLINKMSHIFLLISSLKLLQKINKKSHINMIFFTVNPSEAILRAMCER